MSTGGLTILYTVLVIIGLTISIILMATLSLSPMVFIGIFSLYMCGCSAFLFAFLTIKKKQLVGDTRYTISDYMTLYNSILSLFIFIMCIVIPVVKNRKRVAEESSLRAF